MTVVLVMGILAMIAVPKFTSFNLQQRAEAAVRRITADLSMAQRQARFTGSDRRIVFSVVGNGYTLIGIPDLDHPNQPYVVSLGEEPYGATIVSVNFGGDPELVFDGYGNPDTSGAVVISVGDYKKSVSVEAGTSNVRFIPHDPN